MPIIKCKMCGGDLNLTEGSTVCECEYCGTKQTVPSADNEKKLTLFSRAGRLLRACEFDTAAGVFETIVADFPQEAEAYWGLVLCKYGIEYVDDPATGKKIPTCHRSSFDSVRDDANFEQACENTDAVARRVYRDEARQIEELRQAILQVSGKEEPYDVFISYKETDEHGERTLDSVIAQDIYKELTNEGYRVFFSRISLEDKLGTEYEPYIFAALNSAKVMLVVGTDYENFDAVWVKNEWSRFLKLIAKGEKKTLIPVFKNMDAYDMPKEFAKLAAQDMGKVGAMQDLVRGVEKIVGKKKAEPAQAQPVQQPVYVSGGPNVTAMIERGHQALEDGEWEKADEFFDQALNMNAKCAEAFLGKFLAQEKAVSLDTALNQRLAECDRKAVTETKRIQLDNARAGRLITENLIPGYSVRYLLEKEIHFDPSYPSTADYYADQAPKEKERLRADRLLARSERYAGGELAESIKQSVKRFEDALNQKVQSARDAAVKAKKEKEAAYAVHMERAEEAVLIMRRDAENKREQDYREACRLRQEAKTIPEYGHAINYFRSTGLAEYKDSAKLADECRTAIAEIEEQQRKERAAKEEAERQRKEAEAKAAAERAEQERQRREYEAKIAAEEAERQRNEQEKAEAARKKKKTTIGIIIAAIIVIGIVVAFVISKIVIPGKQYEEAENLLTESNYYEAYQAFGALGSYKDSAVRAASIETDHITDIRYAQICEAQPGDTVRWGHYEQDQNADNGQEEIEWIVLSVENGQAYMISKYVIDEQPYNSVWTDVTWESCSLRGWLNESFYQTAFSREEQSKIIPQLTDFDFTIEWDNFSHHFHFEDYVSMLGEGEAEKYKDALGEYTMGYDVHLLPKFVVKEWWLKGLYAYGSLKSTGELGLGDEFAPITTDGGNHGGLQNDASKGIRPVIIIDLV